MKKFIVALVVTSVLLVAQETPKKYWIYFKDKGTPGLSKSFSAQAIGISERALHRRAKMNQTQISEEDLPVSSSYQDQIRRAGVSIENTSRWFNAATAYLTDEQVKTISAFSFVRSIESVRIFKRKELSPVESSFFKTTEPNIGQKYSYGSSFAQMDMIKAVSVHNIGISGRGVLVGMLDTGFRWRDHEAMMNMKVIGEYDFIQDDTVTANQNGDAGNQDSHGTSTMSLVGGFKDGVLVSPAFNAQFILGKTEYVPSETNVEEDNWVAAIEWMEKNGVDVVSSSLGYSEFDAGQKSYTYNDMNGRTATTSKAAAIAARKGVVVVNAMGNEANSTWHFLTSPADADSIISVGAVNGSGLYASFSSVGPTSDNRTKPDVAAHGVGTYCAVPSGKVGAYSGSQQGTSLATPLVAGVAAQILSAHPELTPIQVRDALRNTASNAASPNNTIGWGIINAYDAVLYHGMVISTDPDTSTTIDGKFTVGVYVVSKNIIIKDSVLLFFSTDGGKTIQHTNMSLSVVVDSTTNSGKYFAIIPKHDSLQFYIHAIDNSNPLPPPEPLFPTLYTLKQNYPNPFNPSTTIEYDLPADGYVTLKVYDVLGNEIATLVNGFQQRKRYAVSFALPHLASGVYFYRLQTAQFSQTKKMVIEK